MKQILIIVILPVFITGPFKTNARQDGESLFKEVCGICHTVNGGKLIGPDLANVNKRRSEEWLLEFITSSQKMINKGDPDAVALFNEYFQIQMPDPPISEAEIKSILTYIASESPEMVAASTEDPVTEEIKPEEAVEETPERSVEDATDEDVDLGRMLFTGNKRLENRGPSCISCHHVVNDKIIGGGLLAKDLTSVFSRMNESGIKAIVSNPPFPVMKEAYKIGLVTDDEAFYLMAFLKDADQERYYQHARNYQTRFLSTGIVGLVILLIIFAGIWWKRRKKSVNQEIFDRQLRSSSSQF